MNEKKKRGAPIWLYIVIGVIILSLFSAGITFFCLPLGVLISENEIVLREDDEYTLDGRAVSIIPLFTNVKWRTGDPLVARVNGGVVTAGKKGECDIIVSTFNGKKAKCHVRVVTYEEHFEEAVNAIVEHVKNECDNFAEGIYMVNMKELDAANSITISATENFLFLTLTTKIYNSEYATTIISKTSTVLQASDAEHSLVVQENSMNVLGLDAVERAEGYILLKNFDEGDEIPISKYTYTIDGVIQGGMKADEETKDTMNNNYKVLVEEFEKYLEENEEIGYTIEDLRYERGE